jgi:hypothetical protein
MSNTSVTELRLRLLKAGIDVLPSTVSKEVFLKDWRNRPIDETEIRSWECHADWPNTSGRTTHTPFLDLDIKDEEVAEEVEGYIRGWFDDRGEILCRVGQPPKRALGFRTDKPFAKRKLTYQSPNGQAHGIEALCDGQQIVLFGYHADAKRDYSWRGGRDPLVVPPTEWPLLTEIELEGLLVALDELLVENFGWTRTHTDGNGHASSAPHITDIDAALSKLCYQGRGGGGNVHDTEFGCINALIVAGGTTEAAIEEVLAAVRTYAANDPLCSRWDWDKERRALEGISYSFVNKFPDYADRLPPELYAIRQQRRGQGVADPVLEYDRLRKCWHYPEPSHGRD